MNKQIMRAMGFDQEVERMERGECAFCGVRIGEGEYRSAVDEAEGRISGLCQRCIDSVFLEDGM